MNQERVTQLHGFLRFAKAAIVRAENCRFNGVNYQHQLEPLMDALVLARGEIDRARDAAGDLFRELPEAPDQSTQADESVRVRGHKRGKVKKNLSQVEPDEPLTTEVEMAETPRKHADHHKADASEKTT
jgi:hypothetical protein